MASNNKKASADAYDDKDIKSTKKSGGKRASAASKRAESAETPELETASDAGKGTSTRSTKSKRTSRKRKKSRNDHKFALLGAGVLMVMLALCTLFSVERVQTNAMMPTLAKGDLVLNLRFSSADAGDDRVRGHIFRVKDDQSKTAPNYLRVIACGNGSVSYKNDALSLNGTPLARLKLTNDAIQRPADEPEIWRESLDHVSWHIMLPQTPIVARHAGAVELTPDACFVAGDNRMASYDSRQNGAVAANRLTSRALLILESSRNDGIFGPFVKLL